MRGHLPVLATLALVACRVSDHSYEQSDAGADAPAGAPAMLVMTNPSGDISFGDVVTGRTSGTNSIAVLNAGDLASGPIALSFDDTTLGFAIVDDQCSQVSLPPHHTCSFRVSFTPAGAGRASTIARASATPGDSATKTVFGTGLVPGTVSVVEDGHDYATQDIRAARAKSTFHIENIGQSVLAAPVATINGDASFVVDSTTCSTTLLPGATCTVTVAFGPSTVGQKASSLTVTSGTQADAASLSGTGTAHVRVTMLGYRTGRVTSFQSGIDCPGTVCEYDFAAPTNLEAIPTSFVGWTGACTGSASCYLDMTSSPESVGADFDEMVGTLAGNLTGDGTGRTAAFTAPYSIAFDPAGNLYVAENTGQGAWRIRKIAIATASVSTFALPSNAFVTAIATDGTRLFWASPYHSINMMDLGSGVATLIAGTDGTAGSSDGIGAAARFDTPCGLALAGPDLFVADTNNSTIRKVVIATGAVTTVAGTAGSRGSADGTRAAARFTNPQGIATDGITAYVADSGNVTVRAIALATGAVTTLAGTAGRSGSNDGTGTAASFECPENLTLFGTGLYISDSCANTIRKVSLPDATVTTLAGAAHVAGGSDGVGATARFASPWGITHDATGLYVADYSNQAVRRIGLDGTVTTLAGGAGSDGVGAAAHFLEPRGLATDGTDLFVADRRDSTIRKIDLATGMVTTLAGAPTQTGSSDGIGSAARFAFPSGVATDGTNLYVADTFNYTIRKIAISTRAVTTLAGLASSPGSVDGVGANARFVSPSAIASDGTSLFVSDGTSIRKIVIATGAATTLAAAGTVGQPRGLTVDGGSLYITDDANYLIRKIALATGVMSTIVPTGVFPEDVTSDGTNLFVIDLNAVGVSQIEIATGATSKLAGAPAYGAHDGPGSTALFNPAQGIVRVGASLYVADTYNNAIRVIH